MGSSRSSKELIRKINSAGTALGKANRQAVGASADVYKDAVLARARVDSGGDLRLSRWGKNGIKLGAGYDIKGDSQARATLTARPMGPWKVLEYGAAQHYIIPGLTRRQGQALHLFSVMAGGRGGFDVAALAETARGNRNNRGGRNRRPRKPLAFGGDVRAYAHHPGTKPKHTWSEGIRIGTPGAVQAYSSVQVTTLATAFK